MVEKNGDSLATLLKEQRVTRDRALEIFLKICDAVSFAHSKKVLHLDLKSINFAM